MPHTLMRPITVSANGVRLEPLSLAHESGLAAAADDGQLWNLRVANVPAPEDTRAWIEKALAQQDAGQRLPLAVVQEGSGRVIGTTSFYEPDPEVRRLALGYTWYAQSAQRTHVNTTCKLLLLSQAFDVLGCAIVVWHTDNFNFASQRAIERLGAKKDGVLRHHKRRRDGTVRDTVTYSMTAAEWPECRAQLLDLLKQHRPA